RKQPLEVAHSLEVPRRANSDAMDAPQPIAPQDSHTLPVRGRWLTAAAFIAVIAAAAMGLIHPVIALPAIAILGTLLAVGYRVNSVAGVSTRPQNLTAESSGAMPLASLIHALPEPALLVDGLGLLIAGNVSAAALFGRLRTNEALSLT